MFEAAGIESAVIPSGINIPSGASWQRLIIWLLNLGDNIPPAAIPDIVSLYTTWSIGMLGLDPFTPHLLGSLYSWLTEIESAHDAAPGISHSRFEGTLAYG